MWGDIGLQQLGFPGKTGHGWNLKVKILKVSFEQANCIFFIPKPSIHNSVFCLDSMFGVLSSFQFVVFSFFFDRYFGCWAPMWSFGRSWCEVFGWGMTSCWQTRTVTASFGGRRRDFGPFIGLVNGEQKINGGEQSWCLDDENKITHVWFVVWLYWR